MTQGPGTRRSSGSSGVTGRITGKGLRLQPVIEVITVSSSSESEGEEDIKILEEKLRRLASRKRKEVKTNKRVHSNKGRHQTQEVTCVRPRGNFTTL